MSNQKYNITLRDLETKHGVAKLERDGFDREKIVSAMYKLTDGAHQDMRTNIINKLFDRSEK